MLATNLQYNSQERYIFEEVYINGKIELIKINKEDYQTNTEHKQIIIEMNEGIQNSKEAQELKAELEEKLNATIKVIKHTADEQNAEAHYHFQILSNDEINNQSIYKVANDFIKAIKGAEMTQIRIYDNSQKNSFELSAEAKSELLKVKEDKFSFIKKDSKSHEIEEIQGYTKEGSKNATGLGKLDRPTYILNGVSNEKAKLISRFGIGMFKSDDIEITEETAKQAIKAFYMNIGQELGENWDSFLNVEIQESEDELSINFNNLIVLNNGHVASTAKNLIEEHLSKILKNAISNERLIIENDDRLKPKEKVLAELQYLSGQEHKSEAEKEEKEEAVEVEIIKEQADQSQATTDFYLDFMVEIKTIKTFEELEAKKAELEAEAEKVEAVRGILPVELINEKLEQIEDKKELLSIVKVEREDIKALKEELEATKKHLAAQTQISETLEQNLTDKVAELETTNKHLVKAIDLVDETKQSLEASNNMNKSLEEQAVKYRTKVKDLESELNSTVEELKATKQSLADEEKSHEETHRVVNSYAKKQKELKLEIEEQEKSINELTVENEQQSKAYKVLEVKQVETEKALKAEEIEAKKYSKLYSDTVSKLEKTEVELKSVNTKLTEKETENKGLIAKVKDFTSEVFNLKDSIKNLTEKKAKLEVIKDELAENLTQEKKKIELGEAYVKQQDKRLKELEELVNNGKAYSNQQDVLIEELQVKIKLLEGKRGQGRGEPK